MNLTKQGKIYMTLCLLSLIFSYLIVTLDYFPHFGISLTLASISFFGYKIKKKKGKEKRLYLTFALAFSVLLFIRSEPFISFLNFASVLFFMSLLFTPFQKTKLGFLEYVYRPVIFIIRSVFGKSDYYFETKNRSKEGSYKAVEVAIGVLLSIFLLALVLPILSSVNPFFENLIAGLWRFLDITNLLEYLGDETAFLWILRLVFFFGFIFVLPKIFTYTDKKLNLSLPFDFDEKIPLTIPKIVLSVTLFIFFITQIQFYLAPLDELGISHSKHTREVFAQLSFVAGIVLFLFYNSRGRETIEKYINWTLGIQGIFLTVMAYVSVFEYIRVWGLTYKRLYGFAFASWVLGVIMLLLYNYKREEGVHLFVKKAIFYSASLLFLVNILNFDYLIYNFAKATTGQGVDYTYLSRLSPDSLSYRQQFEKLEEESSETPFPPADYDNKNPLVILYKIESLQRKYERVDLRTVSILEYLQYRQIKDIDTKSLRELHESYRDLSKTLPRNSL